LKAKRPERGAVVIIPQDKAREKICPLMTVMKSMDAREKHGPAYCVGWDCMLWCWVRQKSESDFGYCGLAGRPEA
jgi:hypothetical protein